MDDHGVGGVFEQRAIIDGVAVEPDLVEIAPAQSLRGQPLFGANDLAFAERRNAHPVAGVAALRVAFEFDADEVLDTEGVGDGAGDEGIGCGDDAAQIACGFVTVNQLLRGRLHLRLHDVAHETGMRGAQFVEVASGNRQQGETQIGGEIEGAGLVLPIERLVLLAVLLGIDPAQLGNVLPEGMVGVEGNQRVVEIEEGELAHGV